MTMRRAQVQDLDRIEAFLTAHAPQAMFPLNNLLTFGFEGDDPYSVRFWFRESEGAITDVLTLTAAGVAMPCLPGGAIAGSAARLAGTPLTGIIGPTAQVRSLEAALTLTEAPRTLDHDEPHFLLDLAGLAVPEGPGRIVPIGDAPENVIREWMLDYQLNALNTPAEDAPARVAFAYSRYVASDSHVVLMEGDMPLAMTGFNAQAPGIVQVGGVYTPPELRGRGHARRALALHLSQAAQAEGIEKATLFSASEAAERAYRAIGFQQIGRWTLLLFRGQERGAVTVTHSDPAPVKA